MAEQDKKLQVHGRDGMLGWIDPREQTGEEDEVLIRLINGQGVIAPREFLAPRDQGGYFLPVSNDQLQPDRELEFEEPQEQETLMVIPVLVERAKIGKKLTTQPVRISKKVHERQERIDDTGYYENIQVERVPVNKEVQSPPKVRSEGNTTIIPMLEEVLVVEKKIILREEVHITLERIPHEPEQVTLRSEEVTVERPERGQ